MFTLEDALAVPGGFLLFACLISKCLAGLVRWKVRPPLHRTVVNQLAFVSRLQQRFRSPWLDILAKLTALSVSVEWYLISIPPVAWLGGPTGGAAAMAVCQCMAISTYMTCALKDMLSCPRPGPASSSVCRAKAKAADLAAAGKAEDAHPNGNGAAAVAGMGVTAGVEVLETAYRGEVEMGAPSMHTWCALVMPAYATAVAAQLGAISPQRAAMLTAVSVCWAAWVALSRLYLGVHTPVDLALGGACGAAMLGLWRRIGLTQMAAVAEPAIAAAAATAWGRTELSAWGLGVAQGCSHSLVALLGVGAAYVLALATYPQPLSHTTSYEYAVIFLGAAYGGLVSASGRISAAPALVRILLGVPPSPASSPEAAPLAVVAVPPQLRHPAVVLLLGFAAVAAVKTISKAILTLVLPRLLGLAPLALRRTWQPPVHPAGCWRPEAVPSAVATITTGPGIKVAGSPPKGRDSVANGGMVHAGSNGVSVCTGAGAKVKTVLMKSPSLAYDVDFLRKFVNYGLTVYAVMEFRFVAAALLAEA